MGSGRTGGTNVMRAAGLIAGASTAILDVMKGVASGWIRGCPGAGERVGQSSGGSDCTAGFDQVDFLYRAGCAG